MLDSMKNRRTIRKYSSEDIERDLLNNLLSIACRAATTGNMQLYSIVVTRDIEKKRELAPAHFNQPMVTQAPVLLTFCADFNRVTRWCEDRDALPGFANFQSFMAAVADVLLVTQSFCTAAEEVGLGTCYLGTTTYNAAPIIKTLNLPKLVVPIATISLGYPEIVPEQVERLPLEAIIHEEHYVDYDLAAIDRLYAEKECFAANQQFVTENGKQTLAQVFTDIRYTEKNNQYFSEQFLQVLKDQGFL